MWWGIRVEYWEVKFWLGLKSLLTNVIKFAKLFLVLLELTPRGLTKETQFCVQIRCVSLSDSLIKLSPQVRPSQALWQRPQWRALKNFMGPSQMVLMKGFEDSWCLQLHILYYGLFDHSGWWGVVWKKKICWTPTNTKNVKLTDME